MPDADRDAKLAAALHKLDDDLGWRGPGGRVQAYALLPRDLAQAVADHLRDIVGASGGSA